MSGLRAAIAHLIKVFQSYSGKEGDKYKLNKSELKNLLVTELGAKDTSVPKVEAMIKTLDQDRDGEVDFEEYVAMVASVAVLTNEFFQK